MNDEESITCQLTEDFLKVRNICNNLRKKEHFNYHFSNFYYEKNHFTVTNFCQLEL